MLTAARRSWFLRAVLPMQVVVCLYAQAPKLSQLPLSFEVNRGQTDSRVQYLVRAGGQTVFLTPDQAVVSIAVPQGPVTRIRSVRDVKKQTLKRAAIRMSFHNSQPANAIQALDPLPGKVNYLIGKDASQWHTDIPTYGRIAYRGVYPGIDLVYHGTEGRLEYDFVASPGSNVNAIQVQFEGADSISVTAEGDLLLNTAAGPLRWKKPYVYQEDHGALQPIAANYRLTRDKRVEFALAQYNRKLPLTIDPVLVYSTYLGGSNQEVLSFYADGFVDSTGIYAGGITYSSNFPITSGAGQTALNGLYDVFVTKLNPQGTALLYSTYIGGDEHNGLDTSLLASDGSMYLAGFTTSDNFPTTVGAYDRSFPDSDSIGWVARLSPTFNSLDFSTLLGGSNYDVVYDLAVDTSGNIYVTGQTEDYDFPTTANALLPYFIGVDNMAFVTKLNPTASTLIYSTYLGGSYDEFVQNPSLGPFPPNIVFSYESVIAVDSSGYAYVAGVTDSCDFPTTSGAYRTTNPCDDGIGYVVKLNTTGTALVYGTLLGGSTFDAVGSIQVDSTGSVVLGGVTGSTNFPTTAGAYSRTYAGGAEDGFAARLDPTGSTLVYSTLFGGSGQEAFVVANLASNGNVMLSGLTYSTNLPTTAGTFQTVYGGNGDSFITVLNPTLSQLVDSTYVGGSGLDVGVARFATGPGDIMLVGSTASTNFPTTTGAFQKTDPGGSNAAYFVARFSLPATPALSISKSHTGSFTEGQAGAVYAVTVSNATGAGSTSGTVTVTETPPSGETLVSMSGSGWSCSGTTCTRSDALAGGSSYPSITVTVNVSAGASSPQVNSVSVSGGGSASAGAMDSTTIVSSGAPVLTISKSHVGNFAPGQQGATYTVTVSNAGTVSTSSAVSVVETVPSGLTLVSMSGSGWTCGGVACTRGDVLGAGGTYPAITVTVNVAANASSPQVNSVAVSGGGSAAAAANDSTTIGSVTTAGLGFYPVTPCRVADTRTGQGFTGQFGPPSMTGGQTRSFTIPSSGCNIPTTAQAYSLNVTVVPATTLGYLTIWPTGQAQPYVSTLNSLNGAILANAAIVPAGSSGSVSVYVTDASNVIIDINGYFAPPAGTALAFYPVTPCRVVDTRNPNGPFGGPSLAAGGTRSFTVPQGSCGIPTTAQAYSLNMTVVPPGPLEYLTVWPTGQTQPYVSALNALQGQVAANAAIVPAGSNGAISVYVSDPSNVLIDINGYFGPPGGTGALYFYPVTPCRVVDTRNPTGALGGPSLGAGTTRTFPIPGSSCGLPSTAEAYSFNMTVVPPGPLFYLTTWPAGQTQPVVSTLNDLQGQVVANAAIVPAGVSGGISVYVSDPTNVVIDVNGYFGQ